MKRAAEREGKLNPMSFRLTPELRAKLEATASKAGRSLSSEVEHRLERSFLLEALILDRFKDIERRLDRIESGSGRAQRLELPLP